MNHHLLEAPGEGAVTLAKPRLHFLELMNQAARAFNEGMQKIVSGIRMHLQKFANQLRRYQELRSRKPPKKIAARKNRIYNIRKRK